jgi:hypothetical protein
MSRATKTLGGYLHTLAAKLGHVLADDTRSREIETVIPYRLEAGDPGDPEHDRVADSSVRALVSALEALALRALDFADRLDPKSPTRRERFVGPSPLSEEPKRVPGGFVIVSRRHYDALERKVRAREEVVVEVSAHERPALATRDGREGTP